MQQLMTKTQQGEVKGSVTAVEESAIKVTAHFAVGGHEGQAIPVEDVDI